MPSWVQRRPTGITFDLYFALLYYFPRAEFRRGRMSLLASPRHSYAALAKNLRFDTENVGYIDFSVRPLLRNSNLRHGFEKRILVVLSDHTDRRKNPLSCLL